MMAKTRTGKDEDLKVAEKNKIRDLMRFQLRKSSWPNYKIEHSLKEQPLTIKPLRMNWSVNTGKSKNS